MKKLLIVVDMQNDFISGALGTQQAAIALPNVVKKASCCKKGGCDIIYTRDTHNNDYLSTQEGRRLPVEHCIKGTHGHAIAGELDTGGCMVIDKPSFGSLELANLAAEGGYDEIELCGLCTDICVVSNAIILKARLPETKIVVNASCCAGATIESHNAALLTMKMCQVEVIGE